MSGFSSSGRYSGRLADAHLEFVVALVVGVVQQLGCPHLAHLRAQAHQRHREQVVGEAGVDAGGEARRLAQLARLGDGLDPVRRVEMHGGPHPRRHGGGAHVDAGAQEAGDQRDVVVGVRRGRAVVHQGVGLERDQRVDVVGRGDTERFGQSADLADVAADLVGIADADADQFEHRMFDDFGDDHLADETRSPDHDSLRHRLPFTLPALPLNPRLPLHGVASPTPRVAGSRRAAPRCERPWPPRRRFLLR